MITLVQITQIIIGMTFFLYLPGYLVTKLVFKKLTTLERILLSTVFSIMLGISIGIFFGYDRAQALRTGGFIEKNIWLAEIVITLLLAISLYIVRRIQEMKKMRIIKSMQEKKKKPTNQ